FGSRPLNRTSVRLGIPHESPLTRFGITYRIQLTEYFALQPDVQYVLNPGTDPSISNALAVGLRFELSWGTEN
ncbi:MAG: carbohydrate porin, partial [Qipengyuania sp.]|nr:carbohydrate porin [Qipengyuania sp.]